jgi:hypothetical protein
MRNIKIFFSYLIIFILGYYLSSIFIYKLHNNVVQQDFLINYWQSYQMKTGNCEIIKNYSNRLIDVSGITEKQENIKNLNELKSLYAKCNYFYNDLKFLNSINNDSAKFINEKEFLFYSIKYYHFIDKEYIIKQIEFNKFKSNNAIFLKDIIVKNKMLIIKS